ncbi:MAG: DsbA family protein [Alphaproteobacteria bacterium]|nr:DsbA family protein [Alphaproteobacteria bacterium]
MLNRRQFGSGLLAAGIVSALGLGAMTPVFAQDVSVEKLMAGNTLPDITIGNKDAKVTIVEYASMSCPHCANFHKNVLPKLKEKYIEPGKVLLVMREFPLNQVAIAVSMLTRCAGDNDKTAALVDVYFDQQDKWLVRGDLEPKLLEIAKQAGFTSESFKKCLENEELFKKLVEQREIASSQFGVNSTPTFFINGKSVTGNIMNIETFSNIIDPLLKAAS